MLTWLLAGAVAVLAGALVWIVAVYVIPAWRLADLTRRIADGETPRHFIGRGAGPFRRATRALETLFERLRRQDAQLAFEEFNLHGILANMVEGVMIVNPHSRVILANDAMRRLFRVNAQPADRTVIEATRNHEIQEIVQKCLAGDAVLNREIQLHGDGSHVHPRAFLSVNATPIRDAGGAVSGAVVVLHDMTHVKQLERERRDFVANTSHELRTPLAIFRGYLETLMDTPSPEPGEVRRILGILQRHSDRLNLLVRDLLALSRLESKMAEVDPMEIELPLFLDQFLEDARRNPLVGQHPIHLDIQGDLPTVVADPGRLEQVLHNLIENAAKYSRSQSPIVLEISRHSPNHARFCVRDHGIGIPPEDLPRVFERFYRVDKARSRDMGGTGLGLTIVQLIVQAHGGRVWAESDVGQGSRFSFTLPLGAETGAETESAPGTAELEEAAV